MKTIILHQVNCKGVMGAGFAKYVKQKFPECYKQYKKYCKENDNLLGKVFVYEDEKYTILNMFSQYDYGTYTAHTNYHAMIEALKWIRYKYPTEKITAPKYIGCGLAGGDWNVVSHLLKEYNIDTSEKIIFE